MTGFGLLGHLHIALEGSGVAARIDAASVPFLAGALEMGRQGFVPSGTVANRAFVSPHVGWGELSDHEQLALADAQTSGGLLISVPEDRAAALADALERREVPAADIGSVEGGPAGRITVERRING